MQTNYSFLSPCKSSQKLTFAWKMEALYLHRQTFSSYSREIEIRSFTRKVFIDPFSILRASVYHNVNDDDCDDDWKENHDNF